MSFLKFSILTTTENDPKNVDGIVLRFQGCNFVKMHNTA